MQVCCWLIYNFVNLISTVENINNVWEVNDYAQGIPELTLKRNRVLKSVFETKKKGKGQKLDTVDLFYLFILGFDLRIVQEITRFCLYVVLDMFNTPFDNMQIM